MKSNWEVLIKNNNDNKSSKKNKTKFPGKNFQEYEFSIIRKDFKHGHQSWGWAASSEKIVLFSHDHNGTPIEPFTKEEWDKCIKLTGLFCDLINKE